MTAVHQFLPTFAPRDAIGTHTLNARRVLRGMGLESEIYADGIRGARGLDVHPFRSFEPAADGRTAHLLYQVSTGSVVAELLRSRPEPTILNHHNVTPSRFVAPWDPRAAAELEVGERQLRRLAPSAVLGLAASAYNEADLRRAGCRRTAVAPVLVDLAGRASPDRRVLSSLLRGKRPGSPDWLFVGRVAPHKCQHDVVRAFAAYRRVYDPHARLWLVGPVGSAPYAAALGDAIATLGLAGAVSLTGSVSPGRLAAHYEAADVFVCASEHEGFCVPVLEAMAHDLPVIAHAAAAVPETAGEAGVLLPSKDPLSMAAAVHRVHTDGRTRDALVVAGRRRAEAFALERSARVFEALIAGVLA